MINIKRNSLLAEVLKGADSKVELEMQEINGGNTGKFKGKVSRNPKGGHETGWTPMKERVEEIGLSRKQLGLKCICEKVSSRFL